MTSSSPTRILAPGRAGSTPRKPFARSVSAPIAADSFADLLPQLDQSRDPDGRGQGVRAIFDKGDIARIEMRAGRITNERTRQERHVPASPPPPPRPARGWRTGGESSARARGPRRFGRPHERRGLSGRRCCPGTAPGGGHREGRKVLDALAGGDRAPWHLEEHAGGAQYYARTGKEWEPEAQTAAHAADAILLGAVGWPGGTMPNGDLAGGALVLGMRSNLDLYANVRPCRLYPGVTHRISGRYSQVWSPENVDMVIIRENTEGLYTPARGRLRRGSSGDRGRDRHPRIIPAKGAERVVRYAFELARRSGRGAPGGRGPSASPASTSRTSWKAAGSFARRSAGSARSTGHRTGLRLRRRLHPVARAPPRNSTMSWSRRT